MSDTLAFLDEFPYLETFSISNIEITDDREEDCPETHQKQNQYRVTDLEIAPKTLLMFENLVSRMPRLTTLSIHSIGTINLLSSIQQWCPNLTSLVLDMSAIYCPSDPIDDFNSRQKQICELWILLFKTLPRLERFIGTDVPCLWSSLMPL
ncbi:hypothetical protein BGZ80_010570 [Entomortierella chlamydospora]|uniref:Uncharacterized protein n=1 Tax=Entomortierella chlamydospora TaxID=101097 RepID=A0A9P6N2N8_9FUNG|nr:hypothetical protein BGZ79_008818 [Entomortierella chlamydospora]KAG0023030.1 hypothetical protein BGZ80_010570 [Entomortierella chlamydospora]